MIIDFQHVEKQAYPNFKGGENTVFLKRIEIDNIKYIEGVIPTGASIGLHMHVGETETIRILEGNANLLYEGVEYKLAAGNVHFCDNGRSHSLSNESEEDLVFFAIIK